MSIPKDWYRLNCSGLILCSNEISLYSLDSSCLKFVCLFVCFPISQRTHEKNIPSGLHVNNSSYETFIIEGQFEQIQHLSLRLSFLEYVKCIVHCSIVFLAWSVDVQKSLITARFFPLIRHVVFLPNNFNTASSKQRLRCLLRFLQWLLKFYVFILVLSLLFTCFVGKGK